MGKLILCSGLRTEKPYVFASTGIRVYSIEELCYYLYQYVYIIDEELFSESLLKWIETELGLVERAEKLKQLKERDADLKTMVTVVLCSADYYTEYEIKVLLKRMDDIIDMPPIKRKCIRANNYLKKSLFVEAEEEYEHIMDSKEAAELTPEEYGDLLHSLAVAKVHIGELDEACEYFRQSYERNQKEKSLQQYLYATKLCKNPESFYEEIEKYQVSQELRDYILKEMEQIDTEANESDRMMEIQQLKKWKTEGKINLYQNTVEDMIEAWKSTIRKI